MPKKGLVEAKEMPELRSGTHMRNQKTHCKRGHEYTPENTYWIKRGARGGNPQGHPDRRCRKCQRIRFEYSRDGIRPLDLEESRRVECECGNPRIKPDWQSACAGCREIESRFYGATTAQQIAEEW